MRNNHSFESRENEHVQGALVAGAGAAKVAEYIDGWLGEHYDSGVRQSWRDDISALNELSSSLFGRRVMQLTPDQRGKLLERISRNEEGSTDSNTVFFGELKRLTARGYSTSKIGIHDEIGYLGNTYIDE